MNKSDKTENISSRLKGRDIDLAVHEFIFQENIQMRIPYYSDNMTDAWRVVHRMSDLKYNFKMVQEGVYYHTKFYQGFSKEVPFSSWPVPAEVICYAALAAIERDGIKRKK